MKKKALYILFLLGFLASIVSCQDESIIDDNFDPSLKGTSEVSFNLEFKPLTPALESRTPGDAIKCINDLNIVIYKADNTNEPYEHLYLTAKDNGFTINESDTDPSYNGNDLGNGKAESTTCRASFKRTLPYGQYKIIAVANYGKQIVFEENKVVDSNDDNKLSESEIRNIQLTWNSSNIPSNNQMFGFFRTDTSFSPVISYDNTSDESLTPTVTIQSTTKELHAWLKRAASKVTVAFDGTDLYENVYIYIHSVQIKDIPNTCLLGRKNTPTSNGSLSNGEIISYREANNTTNTSGITITAGITHGGSNHTESADALFFYENAQGIHDDKPKGQEDTNSNKIPDDRENSIDKDGIEYGTYIEVKGYYVNKTATNASNGEITYRFMLGKDVVKDYDAERNYHYKLTLKFKHDANNPDWHIVYESEKPTISVPSPLYISYVHSEKLIIPVVVRGATVSEFKAEIIDNNWEYENHPFATDGNSGNSFNHDGFLTFKDTSKSTEVFATKRKDDFTNNSSKSFNAVNVDGTEHRFDVPVYTREVKLGEGFSGSNAYMHKTRTAKVKFTAKVNGSWVAPVTIDIIQVKRAVNPAGIWREHDSEKYFHVVLMEIDGPTQSGSSFEDPNQGKYVPTISDGPWTASIVQGDDWVRISKDNSTWGTADVTGSTGTKIDFYYKPSGTCNADQTRCGVIQIRYHNNNCVHYVFVSQGDAPVLMGDLKTKWHTKNLEYRAKEVDTPLHEGSMFRYGNTYTAILADNNFRADYGPFVRKYKKNSNPSGDFWVREEQQLNTTGREWPRGDETNFSLRILRDGGVRGANNVFQPKVKGAKVATVAQWNALMEMPRYYGVLYGENSTGTKMSYSDVYEFPFNGTITQYKESYGGEDKGMRGMFVWDRYTDNSGSGNGGHVFFPMGATGHGHRMQWPDWHDETDGYDDYTYIGVLKYATTSGLMTTRDRPLLVDLHLAWGAIYWCGDWQDYDSTNEWDDDPPIKIHGQNAMDINYHTYDFNTYAELATWCLMTTGANATYTQASDACFIRLVDE